MGRRSSFAREHTPPLASAVRTLCAVLLWPVLCELLQGLAAAKGKTLLRELLLDEVGCGPQGVAALARAMASSDERHPATMRRSMQVSGSCWLPSHAAALW